MMGQVLAAPALRYALIGLAAGILVVILATAYGQVLLNGWNRPFYDAIERRNLEDFFAQLLVFGEIAGGLLVLNVGQSWLNQMLHLKMRQGLTQDLMAHWMRPGCAHRLSRAGDIGVNPDQRMHEDARHLADLTTDLSVGLVQAAILLVSFVGVLWQISSGFWFHIFGMDLVIPGYMVWAAVLYAGAASCLSWLAGRPLIKLNSERYAREAAFRFSLVRVNEHLETIAIARGEAGEALRLERNLGSVLLATRHIMSAMVRLTWVTAGYGWITVVAPIVIASPVYFAGHLSFGGLMMAAAAFTQVHASLRWFVDHIGAIADWRATLLRVTTFRAALIETGRQNDPAGAILLRETELDRISIKNLELSLSGKRAKLSDTHAVVAPGERVAIAAEAIMRPALFKALAGVWAEGRGTVVFPKDQAVAFVAPGSYLPLGTLREALCYPRAPNAFADGCLDAALTRVGLTGLRGCLDRDARWDRELDEEGQRLLAFARLLIHQPRWIIMQDGFEGLPGPVRRRILGLIKEELADAAVISIGGQNHDAAFTRMLHLQPAAELALEAMFPAPAEPRRRREAAFSA